MAIELFDQKYIAVIEHPPCTLHLEMCKIQLFINLKKNDVDVEFIRR